MCVCVCVLIPSTLFISSLIFLSMHFSLIHVLRLLLCPGFPRCSSSRPIFRKSLILLRFPSLLLVAHICHLLVFPSACRFVRCCRPPQHPRGPGAGGRGREGRKREGRGKTAQMKFNKISSPLVPRTRTFTIYTIARRTAGSVGGHHGDAASSAP